MVEHSFNVQTLSLPLADLASGRANFALDIGGSLVKLAYIDKNQGECGKVTTVHLMSFRADQLDLCLPYVRDEVVTLNDHHLTACVTGVGCMKHRETIAGTIGIRVQVDTDELVHAAQGLDVLWRHLSPSELLYADSDVTGLEFRTSLANSGLLPCLLVNIGSALTISKIEEGMTSVNIVSGSAQGGLTFVGLGALLTNARSYSELIELAERGERRNVDLLVKDTAGGDYNIAVSDDLVSSFGKAALCDATNGTGRPQFKEEDIASSLLYCITDQFTQTTYMAALCSGVHHAVFCGSFVAHNPTIMAQIKQKLQQCSAYLRHQLSPIFVKYEGYLGAIGSLANGAST